MAKATLVYDGECGFCLAWIGRWRAWTDGSVDAISADEAKPRFSGISDEEYQRSVQYIAGDGAVASGAEAIFQSLADGAATAIPLRLYRQFDLFQRVSERGYEFVANRRGFFSTVTRVLWGACVQPP
ncbi:MAG: hypothetical protein COB53_08660, partial [Elusimicrobia bacterium]